MSKEVDEAFERLASVDTKPFNDALKDLSRLAIEACEARGLTAEQVQLILDAAYATAYDWDD